MRSVDAVSRHPVLKYGDDGLAVAPGLAHLPLAYRA
jgi:hypothetical protein